MTLLASTDFDLVNDLTRILNILPTYWTKDTDSTIRFFAQLGHRLDASEFTAYLDDEGVLAAEDLDEDGNVVGVVRSEPIEGVHRYVQLVVRNTRIPGPLLLEGHVWPAGVTQEQAEAALLALQEVGEDDEPEPEEEVVPTTPTVSRPSTVARSRFVKSHSRDTGFWAWLRRNF